jgi:mycothiol S-conjugate amidase
MPVGAVHGVGDNGAQTRVRKKGSRSVNEAGRSDAAPKRLMAVHAHPDDESSKGAATLAKYAAQGAEVVVVSCTGGERGDILNQSYVLTDEPLADVRRREMAEAAKILGVRHVWLGFEDSGYHEGPPETWQLPEGSFAALDTEPEIEALVRLIRSLPPQVVITYDESGGYPHPDHIRTHVVSVAAVDAAADPQAFPEAGEPWQVLKLYYHGGFSRKRLEAINSAMKAFNGTEPFAAWLERMDRSARADRTPKITTRVDVCDYLKVRDAALRAHATQIAPDDEHWFAVPHEVEAATWGTDDYELVWSKVDTTVPEDDIFAGITERVGV